MNRIILIGNGFDLAHGLRTSYRDFLQWIEAKGSCCLATNVFLKHLYTKQALNNWVNIENEYFNLLVEFSRDNALNISQLNSDFKEVKKLLGIYLDEVSSNLDSTTHKSTISQIEQRIYNAIDPSEIVSFENREKFYEGLIVSLGTDTIGDLDHFRPQKLIEKKEGCKNKSYYNFLEKYDSI
ncbi:MAG: AbiH family protein, partial [Bacteroides sp.]